MQAFAKVNLFLQVFGVDENQMHKLQTVFYKVEELSDFVSLIPSTAEIAIEMVDKRGSEIKISLQDNLIYKAWVLFNENAPQRIENVKFTVQKNIPIAGGMAGGSTDAAAALLLLNDELKKRTGEKLPFETLLTISEKLGADVAFCLYANSLFGPVAAKGEHYGEKITLIETNLKLDFEFKFCSIGNSTKDVYQEWDRINQSRRGFCATGCVHSGIGFHHLITALEENDQAGVLECLFNDLEDAALNLNPLIKREPGMMISGSGPTLFRII